MLKTLFTFERTVCRLIAAFCMMSFIRSFWVDGLDIESTAGEPLLPIICSFIFIFVIFSVIKYIFINKEVDSVLLILASSLLCASLLLCGSDVEDTFLYALGLALVYSFFLFYFLHKNAELIKNIKLGNRMTYLSIGVFAFICAAVISLIGIFRLLTFSSPNFDFGLFVNMFHNMSEGGLMVTTSERDVLLPHFAVHISPIYYLILPFYYIIPSPYTLQILQALILISGIIPLVKLCKKFGLSNKLIAVFGLLYAFYPAISTGCLYDLHENCFLLPLLLWTFCFFEKRRYLLMYIFALLTLAVKEDAAIYVMIFALYMIFSGKKEGKRRDKLHGIILFVASLAYFIAAISLLDHLGGYYSQLYANDTPNPAIKGAMTGRFDNLMQSEDEGLIGVFKTFFTNPGYVVSQLFSSPDKLKYLIQMLLPLGFIPLITKHFSRFILLIPMLINLLTDYIYQYDIGFQYHFGITAFLFYITLMNVSELKYEVRKNLLSIGCIISVCLFMTLSVGKMNDYIDKWDINKESYISTMQILDEIPDDASVSCSTMFLPHLADRDEVYQTHYHGKDADVDYLVIDRRYDYDDELVKYYLNNGYDYTEITDEVLVLAREVN